MELIVWCFLQIQYSIDGEFYATAAQGRVLQEKTSHYVVDFSKYAKSKRYLGKYDNIVVDKDMCTNSNYKE
jgi:hypothetical protein